MIDNRPSLENGRWAEDWLRQGRGVVIWWKSDGRFMLEAEKYLFCRNGRHFYALLDRRPNDTMRFCGEAWYVAWRGTMISALFRHRPLGSFAHNSLTEFVIRWPDAGQVPRGRRIIYIALLPNGGVFCFVLQTIALAEFISAQSLSAGEGFVRKSRYVLRGSARLLP